MHDRASDPVIWDWVHFLSRAGHQHLPYRFQVYFGYFVITVFQCWVIEKLGGCLNAKHLNVRQCLPKKWVAQKKSYDTAADAIVG